MSEFVRIIRVFPRRTSLTPTDPLAFVGDPPLPEFRPVPEDVSEVHISVTFTWDVREAERLRLAWLQYYPRVLIGGPAWHGNRVDGFEPGRYVREGVTFTSRGCDNRCPWCLVPQREGRLREYGQIASGWIIQDNNFLACPPEHRRKVYAMLDRQPRAAVFSGGLDARLLTDEIARELQAIRIGEVFLACDTEAALRPLEAALNRLHWLRRRQKRVYVLCAYGGENWEQAEARLERIWQMGAMPFAQLYRSAEGGEQYSKEWRDLARKWSRPAAMAAHHYAHNAGREMLARGGRK